MNLEGLGIHGETGAGREGITGRVRLSQKRKWKAWEEQWGTFETRIQLLGSRKKADDALIH